MTAIRLAIITLLFLAIGVGMTQDAEIVIARDAAPSADGFKLTLIAKRIQPPAVRDARRRRL